MRQFTLEYPSFSAPDPQKMAGRVVVGRWDLPGPHPIVKSILTTLYDTFVTLTRQSGIFSCFAAFK
jgi:hypothetical protein